MWVPEHQVYCGHQSLRRLVRHRYLLHCQYPRVVGQGLWFLTNSYECPYPMLDFETQSSSKRPGVMNGSSEEVALGRPRG